MLDVIKTFNYKVSPINAIRVPFYKAEKKARRTPIKNELKPLNLIIQQKKDLEQKLKQKLKQEVTLTTQQEKELQKELQRREKVQLQFNYEEELLELKQRINFTQQQKQEIQKELQKLLAAELEKNPGLNLTPEQKKRRNQLKILHQKLRKEKTPYFIVELKKELEALNDKQEIETFAFNFLETLKEAVNFSSNTREKLFQGIEANEKEMEKYCNKSHPTFFFITKISNFNQEECEEINNLFCGMIKAVKDFNATRDKKDDVIRIIANNAAQIDSLLTTIAARNEIRADFLHDQRLNINDAAQYDEEKRCRENQTKADRLSDLSHMFATNMINRVLIKTRNTELRRLGYHITTITSCLDDIKEVTGKNENQRVSSIRKKTINQQMKIVPFSVDKKNNGHSF